MIEQQTELDRRPRQVAERVFEAFGRHDLEGVLDSFAQDGIIRVKGAPGVPFVGTFGDESSRRRFFRSLFEDVEPLEFEMNNILEDGEHAVVLASAAFRVKKTGGIYATDIAVHLEVKDGKLELWHAYEDSFAVGLAFRAI